MLRISAKSGEGGEGAARGDRARASRRPRAMPTSPPRALIFDSEFDPYRGVVAYMRVVDGALHKGDRLVAMQTGTEADVDEIGFFGPDMTPVDTLHAGEVGYLITGIKDVSLLRVGDTLTAKARPAREPLPGYREVKPMVFCGLFPVDTDQFPDLRDALEKLVPQRRRAVLGARDQPGARLRLSLRLPRPAAHGHRARAPRARVRPRAAGHHAQRRVRGDAHRRQRAGRALAHRDARPRLDRGDPRALHPRHDPAARRSTSAP